MQFTDYASQKALDGQLPTQEYRTEFAVDWRTRRRVYQVQLTYHVSGGHVIVVKTIVNGNPGEWLWDMITDAESRAWDVEMLRRWFAKYGLDVRKAG